MPISREKILVSNQGADPRALVALRVVTMPYLPNLLDFIIIIIFFVLILKQLSWSPLLKSKDEIRGCSNPKTREEICSSFIHTLTFGKDTEYLSP